MPKWLQRLFGLKPLSEIRAPLMREPRHLYAIVFDLIGVEPSSKTYKYIWFAEANYIRIAINAKGNPQFEVAKAESWKYGLEPAHLSWQPAGKAYPEGCIWFEGYSSNSDGTARIPAFGTMTLTPPA